jgi:hypothetical protein
MLNPDPTTAVSLPHPLCGGAVGRPLLHERIVAAAQRYLLEPLGRAIFDNHEECMRL